MAPIKNSEKRERNYRKQDTPSHDENVYKQKSDYNKNT